MAAKAPEAASEKQLELAYWNAIKDGGRIAYFEAYLQQYPNGTFAGLARVRVGELKAAAEREAEKKAAVEQAVKEQAAAEQAAKEKSEAERLVAEMAARDRKEQERIAAEQENAKQAERQAKLKAEADAKAAEAARQREKEAEIAYWASIKGGGGTAYFEAYLAKYPNGQFADLARIRIADIRRAAEKAEADRIAKEKTAAEQKAKDQQEIVVAKLEQPAPKADEAAPSIDPRELALQTQKELARLGCLSAKADGNWGGGSEKALKDYADRQGVKLASLEPTADVLDRLKATTIRVCPLVCGRGLEEKNGRCEKVKQEASVPNKRADDKLQPNKEAKSKEKIAKTDKECYVCNNQGHAADLTICIAKGQPITSMFPDPRLCRRL